VSQSTFDPNTSRVHVTGITTKLTCWLLLADMIQHRTEKCWTSKLLIKYLDLRDIFRVQGETIMNTTVFWDVTPCSLLETYRRIGGTYCSYLQSRISTSRTVLTLQKLHLRLESLVFRSARQPPKHSQEHRGAALELPAQLQPRANGSQSELWANGCSILRVGAGIDWKLHCLYRDVTHASLQTFRCVVVLQVSEKNNILLIV
jgi:hypothetical protein